MNITRLFYLTGFVGRSILHNTELIDPKINMHILTTIVIFHSFGEVLRF